MKGLLFLICTMLLLSACSDRAEKSPHGQQTSMAGTSSTASAAAKAPAVQQSQPESGADAPVSASTGAATADG